MNWLEFSEKINELYLELKSLEERMVDAETYDDQFRADGEDECIITFWDGRVNRTRGLRVSKEVIESAIRQEKILLFEKINKIERELLALVRSQANSDWSGMGSEEK